MNPRAMALMNLADAVDAAAGALRELILTEVDAEVAPVRTLTDVELIDVGVHPLGAFKFEIAADESPAVDLIAALRQSIEAVQARRQEGKR